MDTRLIDDGKYELYGKATGQRFTFRPVAQTFSEQQPDEQESRYWHERYAAERWEIIICEKSWK